MGRISSRHIFKREIKRGREGAEAELKIRKRVENRKAGREKRKLGMVESRKKNRDK